MKKNILLIITLSVLLTQTSIAQNLYKGEISVDVSTYTKQKSKVIVNADIILDKLRIATNDMLTITPVIQSLDGTDKIEFKPLIINGTTRNKATLRSIFFGDHNDLKNMSFVLNRQNGEPQRFSYSFETAYQPWMRNSELVFIETMTGCNCEYKEGKTYLGGKLELPLPYTPQFELAYLVPEVEAVKHRTDSYSASLDYAINKSAIDPNFKNNTAVLEEVDRIIAGVKNDPNITLDKIEVVGYASPDGSTTYNLSLSEKRAKSFTDYLTSEHNLSANRITTSWKGEDWQGLRSAIEKSDYSYRNDVLQIIDNTSDINKRKAALKGLQNGTVYRHLLEAFFPMLRRNSYDILYTVRGLDVEQSKALIYTKPQQLSLNEIFMVANSYEKGSEQFKEAFAIALKLYPDNPIARFNNYTLDIETGSFENATTQLPAANSTEACNNLGVVSFNQGDYDRAIYYFEKASQAGLKEAVHNLSQYKQWLENKDN